MNHLSSFREVLDEAVEAPHEIVGDPVEAAALPVYQHGGEHVALPVNLLQHEVVDLGVAVHQSLQPGQRFLLLQVFVHAEKEFVELG